MKSSRVKMSKGIRKQLVEKHIHKYDDADGHYSLADIFPEDVTPEEVMPIMEKWLDANCSNGHFSRWTFFGQGLYVEAAEFAESLAAEYAAFGF